MPLKKTFRKSILSLTVLFAFSIPPVSANDASQPTFTDLLQAYTQQQPQQQTLSGLQALQQAQKKQSNGWIAGDINMVLHHENDALTDDNDAQNWQVGAEFPIWLPSQKQGLSDLADVYQQSFPIEQAYLSWQASGILRQLIWDYQIASAEFAIAQQTLTTSKQLLESVQKQVALGESALIDGVLAEQTFLNHKAALIKQQSQLDMAKQAYQKWTGFNALPTTIVETKAKVDFEQHPDILLLESQLALANATLRQIETQKTGQPSLYFGAQQDKLASQTDTSLVMEVSIPLGVSSEFGVQKAQQKLQIQRNQASVEQAKKSILLAQQQAEQRLIQLQFSLDLTAQQQNLAQQALEMSLKAYKLGAITVQNLLLIQQQAIDAKRNAVLAQHQFGQATANYNQISGDILGATHP